MDQRKTLSRISIFGLAGLLVGGCSTPSADRPEVNTSLVTPPDVYTAGFLAGIQYVDAHEKGVHAVIVGVTTEPGMVYIDVLVYGVAEPSSLSVESISQRISKQIYRYVSIQCGDIEIRPEGRFPQPPAGSGIISEYHYFVEPEPFTAALVGGGLLVLQRSSIVSSKLTGDENCTAEWTEASFHALGAHASLRPALPPCFTE